MKHHSYAPVPPLGWNSWDCYGAAVREEEIRGNADYMAQYLKPYGWEYIVVDIQWYEAGAVSSQYRSFVPLEMDRYSRLMPAVNRFPSAAEGKGFKPLADYVHGLGLKFGIHIMRGIPRQAVHADTPIKGTIATARTIAHSNSICPWNTDMYGVDAGAQGAQEYYDSIFQLYAEWGVDFLKVDDIAASRLYGMHGDEISLIRQAIDRCGRPMVLSLSPGPAPVDQAEALIKGANMWRMTDDFWDLWPLLYGMFERCEKWAEHVGPGHWPDCDMLPLGHLGIRSVDGGAADRWTRFTKDEQITMMTLWSIFRSPLMFGGEMRDNDDWTLSLLTNKEVLDMHRDSEHARLVHSSKDQVVWTTRDRSGNVYLALFNTSEVAANIQVEYDALGISTPTHIRDLWKHTDLSAAEFGLTTHIPSHGAALYKLS